MSDSPRPVIDRNGNRFPSIEAAAERYGVSPRLILRYVDGNKFGWKYAKQPGIDKQ
jgi:hypothetical protein